MVHMICPVCQLSIPNSEIMTHLRTCLEKVKEAGRKAFFDSALCLCCLCVVFCVVCVVAVLYGLLCCVVL